MQQNCDRLGEGYPHLVEILTISCLKWCNLVRFRGLVYLVLFDPCRQGSRLRSGKGAVR